MVNTTSRTATVTLPGSKSVTARALFLAALADGESRLVAPLEAADTVAFADGLAALGFGVVRDGDVWSITGDPSGPPADTAEVWCHDAGTAARFLPGLVSLGTGQFAIDASEQMRARPMRPLLEALRALGVRVHAADGDRLPLRIDADGVAGGVVRVDAGASSQYLSALCMMGPGTKNGLSIEVLDEVSVPYVELTLAMMREFGASVSRQGSRITIAPGTYQAREYVIEPDASTASYFFAAAAVTGNTVTLLGLGRRSRQGDLRFATEVLPAMGCEVTVADDRTTVTGPARLRSPGTVVMRDISDTMMTLAAIAPFADGPVRITDVANCRVKESDRIDAMSSALGACGIATSSGPDWLEITPGRPRAATVQTRADHRIAMSMSVLGLRTPGVRFDDPACVRKTFPDFHSVFAGLQETWRRG
ncbi:3-phosphoshikimate 1-carboxyvinyltransferase [Actinoplanes aureus]|uniref:3-phosphoshikimate 1-carboxyvinyltransferase n=1 Tax=Actinoplanes aureus TaxID=2792083 RepID=A0A931CHQ6_9ACTN|nr:3-phosphoshikimate 1-carboxyvinyltransferase [Actinoplanes aureus]MBG0566373.1 3-phosphoshikimate 1-carboxyvinyltransferase [Actinoplanes aureus]